MDEGGFTSSLGGQGKAARAGREDTGAPCAPTTPLGWGPGRRGSAGEARLSPGLLPSCSRGAGLPAEAGQGWTPPAGARLRTRRTAFPGGARAPCCALSASSPVCSRVNVAQPRGSRPGARTPWPVRGTGLEPGTFHKGRPRCPLFQVRTPGGRPCGEPGGVGKEPDLGQAVMGYPARWEHPWMWTSEQRPVFGEPGSPGALQMSHCTCSRTCVTPGSSAHGSRQCLRETCMPQ